MASKARPPPPREAYDCYLRGRQLLRERSAERNREARTLLERAIELDGRFSDAFAALAGVHVLDYVNRWRGPAEESRRLSRAAAERAVALDGRSANAHWALGLIHMGDNQLERAIAEAREALALDPNFAVAHSLLGQALYYAGQSEDALQSLSTAVRLDPYNDLFLHLLAHVHFGNEQYEEAAATLKRRILRKPDTDLSRVLLASCCGHLGRTDEARALWREVFQVNPSYSFEHHQSTLPFRYPRDLARIAEGLRAAGLIPSRWRSVGRTTCA